MSSIAQHARWLPAITAAVTIVAGLSQLLSGASYLAPAVTGESAETLAAGSPQAYRLVEAEVRLGGVHLTLFGALLLAVVVFGLRRNALWAWWTVWSLPLVAAGNVAVQLATVAPGQVPDGSVYTATVLAVLNSGALVISAPRFFGRSPLPANA